MVALRIDGREFSRVIIPRNSHSERTISCFYTASINAEGNQVIHANTLQIREAVGVQTLPADQ